MFSYGYTTVQKERFGCEFFDVRVATLVDSGSRYLIDQKVSQNWKADYV